VSKNDEYKKQSLRTAERHKLENFATRVNQLVYFVALAQKIAAELGSNILRLSFCGFGCQV